MANQLQPIQSRGTDVSTLRNEMDRLLEQFTSGFGLPSFRGTFDIGSGSGVASGLIAHTDIAEDDTAYRITIDLPGIEQSDIDVSVRGDNLLAVRAERRRDEERTEQRRNQHLSERSYGVVQRSFRLPDDVERDKLEAQFRNGVLKLTVPKSQQNRQQRRIEVKG